MPAFFEAGKPGALKAALEELCAAAEGAVRGGAGCLVISDRGELDEARVPIPTLLAVGAVHHHLITARLRSDTSIVAETAQAFSTHHIAVLVGYGAHGVVPYLALESCRQWQCAPRTKNLVKSGRIPALSMRAAQRNFKKALEKGVLKILSKMGISLLSCYHGAQARCALSALSLHPFFILSTLSLHSLCQRRIASRSVCLHVAPQLQHACHRAHCAT
jgi:glutamate synthase (ferredoxin)